MNDNILRLLTAVKLRSCEEIKALLKKGVDVNSVLITSGEKAGYTALHFACFKSWKELTKLLIEDCNADVNVVADSGAQPLHIAALNKSIDIVKLLLDSGANADAEFGYNVFRKYSINKDSLWFYDFGYKVTLFNFALFNKKLKLAYELSLKITNIEIDDIYKRTSLMIAIQNNWDDSAHRIIDIMKKQDRCEIVNARDMYDQHVFHYFLHECKYGDCRYDQKELERGGNFNRRSLLKSLIDIGADIYATVEENPYTLILNIAAYRNCFYTLEILLPYYTSINQSRALRIVTSPDNRDPQKLLRLHSDKKGDNQPGNRDPLKIIRLQHRLSFECIIKDLICRRAFGLFEPETEMELMDYLVANVHNNHIRKFVHDYKSSFIERLLKNNFIHYRDEKITLHELAKRSFDYQKVKVLARDEDFIRAFKKFSESMFVNTNGDVMSFMIMLNCRIGRAYKKRKLLEESMKIQQLKEFIPFSHEIIFYALDCLNNYDLEKLIKAFDVKCNYPHIDLKDYDIL